MKDFFRSSLFSFLFFTFLIALFGLRFQATAQTNQRKETRISGQMLAADGGSLAGVILIEKGRLYGKNYKYGGVVDEKGRFSVKVPEGGDYGLHFYATGYIYFPIGVNVNAGKDNQFSFTLPPNAAVKDAPVISKVRFEPIEGRSKQVAIKLLVHDPNQNLSHQVLGANIRTQEGFIFSPPIFVAPWTRDYPDGVYTLTYDPEGRVFDPQEWYFVAADNRCYNSPVLRHPFIAGGVVTARVRKKPKPSTTPDQPSKEIDEEQLDELGRKVYGSNCIICHYADSKKTKVGPGLKGLFKERLTPVKKVPVTEENILIQIQKGSEQMPPYAHISGDSLRALLAYLKSL